MTPLLMQQVRRHAVVSHAIYTSSSPVASFDPLFFYLRVCMFIVKCACYGCVVVAVERNIVPITSCKRKMSKEAKARKRKAAIGVARTTNKTTAATSRKKKESSNKKRVLRKAPCPSSSNQMNPANKTCDEEQGCDDDHAALGGGFEEIIIALATKKEKAKTNTATFLAKVGAFQKVINKRK